MSNLKKPKKYLFYNLLINNLIASFTNNFVWFALTFWAILETRSVIVASVIAGIFAVSNMIGAVIIGGYVDNHRKKTAMVVSSIISLFAFSFGSVIYFVSIFNTKVLVTSPMLWLFVAILMIGTVAGNMRLIALSTSVSLLYNEHERDKANGLVGTVQGISFSLTSIFSGIVISFFGMNYALLIAIFFTLIPLLHIAFLAFPEKLTIENNENQKKLDIIGTIAIVSSIPGLLALIFFQSINNFLGGVFMALMDIYGLSLVNVETWGFLWGGVSFAMIAGGMFVAKYGVGKNPLKSIMIVNVVSWISCIIFPIQASIILLIIGMVVWMFLMPIAESAEQTVIQNIVPQERQGRVFGFAQSIESSAMPVTAFLVGPLASSIFIPFMTTGKGVEYIGSWFGSGESRGIALVFITAGFVGVIVTVFAWTSKPYKNLTKFYKINISRHLKTES